MHLIIKDVDEMSKKVKNPLHKFKPEELLADITKLHNQISDFTAKNFKQIENERKEKESKHKKLIKELAVPSAEQIHNQVETTIQSYEHLQNAKERYVSKISEIRQISGLDINVWITSVVQFI